MDFNEKDIIKRFAQIRIKYYGVRGKSSFAKDLGISPSTYNYYENDRVPPINLLVKASKLLGVSLGWLITGDENMGGDEGNSSKYINFIEKLENISACNPHALQAVMAFMDILGQTESIISDDNNERSGWIPVLGRTAAGIVSKWQDVISDQPSNLETQLEDLVEKHVTNKVEKLAAIANAGSDNVGSKLDVSVKPVLVQTQPAEDEAICEFVDCVDIKRKYPDAFALRVDGDSMSPRINDGQVIILSPSLKPSQGHVAVVKVKDQIGVTCKIIRISKDGMHLIPINERYETKIVPLDQILWSLAVISKIDIC